MILAAASLITGRSASTTERGSPFSHEVVIDELEFTGSTDDAAWDIAASFGNEQQRLVLESSGGRSENRTGTHEILLLYSHSITDQWDIHAGWRTDVHPTPHHNWLTLGSAGSLGRGVETELRAYLGAGGRSSFTVQVGTELPVSSRFSLVPDLEAIVYGKDDPQTAYGDGLTETILSMRLRYNTGHNISPYLGYYWSVLYGATADLARAMGGQARQSSFLLGIHARF